MKVTAFAFCDDCAWVKVARKNQREYREHYERKEGEQEREVEVGDAAADACKEQLSGFVDG